MTDQPKISDDGQFYWDGSAWQPLPPRPARSFPATWKIVLAILIAVAIVSGLRAYESGRDQAKCEIDNLNDITAGEPTQECDDSK